MKRKDGIEAGEERIRAVQNSYMSLSVFRVIVDECYESRE